MSLWESDLAGLSARDAERRWTQTRIAMGEVFHGFAGAMFAGTGPYSGTSA